MSESLTVTIVYEQGDEGWLVASVPEVPGAHSQGRTREEARANVIDALRGILELRFGGHPGAAKGPTANRSNLSSAREAPRSRAPPARPRRGTLREGGNHSFWEFDAERSTAVPRHREIDFRLARLRAAGSEATDRVREDRVCAWRAPTGAPTDG
jgi:predicted RNase H-like HicB family nuclease